MSAWSCGASTNYGCCIYLTVDTEVVAYLHQELLWSPRLQEEVLVLMTGYSAWGPLQPAVLLLWAIGSIVSKG